MYDAQEVLRLVDDRIALVMLFGGLSFGCLFVYFIETARLGMRHRVAPMTLTAVTAFIAHDGNFSSTSTTGSARTTTGCSRGSGWRS